jgi:hypothetical protein
VLKDQSSAVIQGVFPYPCPPVMPRPLAKLLPRCLLSLIPSVGGGLRMVVRT